MSSAAAPPRAFARRPAGGSSHSDLSAACGAPGLRQQLSPATMTATPVHPKLCLLGDVAEETYVFAVVSKGIGGITGTWGSATQPMPFEILGHLQYVGLFLAWSPYHSAGL